MYLDFFVNDSVLKSLKCPTLKSKLKWSILSILASSSLFSCGMGSPIILIFSSFIYELILLLTILLSYSNKTPLPYIFFNN